MVLATQEDVDNFAATGVRKIYGNLTVGTDAESSPVENLDGLAQLEEVTGTVRILGSYTGSDLSGLKNLQIAGNIIMGELQTVSLNTSLQTIVLPALKEIKGDFLSIVRLWKSWSLNRCCQWVEHSFLNQAGLMIL